MVRPVTPSRRRLIVLPLVLLAAGCSDDMTSPARVPAPDGARLSSTSGGRPSFTPNSKKYRAQTYAHSSNRSGSASLTSRALLGKDGKTVLEVTTGQLDATGAPGTISKLQVKLMDHARAVQSTQNYNNLNAGGSVQQTYEGRARHSWVQAQGNVRGFDPKRTDVVTVTERVNLRPDLKVASVTAPEQARVNTPITISSVVAEINGDVGATNRCVLYVDGQQADQAEGVWIADGDAVNCEFVHTFGTVGTHQVRVASENVVPGDWDMANNAKEASIQIVSPETALHGWASASEYGWEYHYTDRGNWSSYYGSGTWDYQQDQDYKGQSAYLYGWAPGSLQSASTSFDVTITSGSNTVASYSAPGQPTWWYGPNCTAFYGNGDYARACSYGGHTSVEVGHYATRTVYYSRYHSEGWDWWYGYYYYHSVDGPWSYESGNYRDFGSSVDFDVRVSDGSNTYTASPSVAIQGYEYSWGSPQESCYNYSDWYYYGYGWTGCYANWGRESQRSGGTGY